MLPIVVAVFGLMMTADAPAARESVVTIAEIPTAVAADLLATAPPDLLQTQKQPDKSDGAQNQGEKRDGADKAEQKKPPTPPHTGVHALLDGLKEDIRHLPSMPNVYLAALGGGLALGAHPF